MRQDLRDALRGLRRAPTFTLVAVITLALAIGSTTAVFSVVDAILIRGLPYAEPDRLQAIYERGEQGGATRPVVSDVSRLANTEPPRPTVSLKEWRSSVATASRSPAATTGISPHT